MNEEYQKSKFKSQKFNSNIKSDLRKRCYLYSLGMIRLLDALPNKKACWIISDQLLRSSTSIGANLVEARASSSRLEYKKFFEIALKSANESKYWLCLLRDSGFGDKLVIERFLTETEEIAKMIAAAVIKLKAARKTFDF